VAADGHVTWREVPDPTPTPIETPTREQVPEMTPVLDTPDLLTAPGPDGTAVGRAR
jgi:hypothetical protein